MKKKSTYADGYAVQAVGIDLTTLAAGHGRGRRAHGYADGLVMPTAAVAMFAAGPTTYVCRRVPSA